MNLCETIAWARASCINGTFILCLANIALVYYTARYVKLTNSLLINSYKLWRPQLQMYGLISVDDCPIIVFQNNGTTSAFELNFSIKKHLTGPIEEFKQHLKISKLVIRLSQK